MFDIQFPHLVKNQLPMDRRTPFNVALQRWWLSKVRSLHIKARKRGVRLYKEATTTTQIGSLVKFLNFYFDSLLDRIYITDVEWTEDPYIYLVGEPYPDLYIYLDSETIAPEDEVWVYTDPEVNPTQFIVWIPASLDTPEDIEAIRAVLDQLCLAGKFYTIQIIP